MVGDEEMASAGNVHCGSAMMAGRTLRPSALRCLSANEAANEQEPLWIEPDPLGWDAPISFWWDQPPAGMT
jgi:hypothetical protein